VTRETIDELDSGDDLIHDLDDDPDTRLDADEMKSVVGCLRCPGALRSASIAVWRKQFCCCSWRCYLASIKRRFYARQQELL